MPRGVPKNGFRMTRKRMDEGFSPRNYTIVPRADIPVTILEPVKVETDEEIDARIDERFTVLNHLIDMALEGEARAVIVSGPPGLGKSFTIEKKLNEWDPNKTNHDIVKGFVKPTGLFKLLFKYREAGQVLVFDDADSIFHDDNSLNFLKAVCDTTERRTVSYMSEFKMFDDETNESIPKTFEFNGTIIFITNYDFDGLIKKEHKLTPHLQALMSRAHYIDLTMKTSRDHLIRIKQVVKTGLFEDGIINLNEKEANDVIDFIEKNHGNMRKLSLREAIKIAALRKKYPTTKWEKLAKITCCKN